MPHRDPAAKETTTVSVPTRSCEKGADPATCTPEQIRECHGAAAAHPCGASAAPPSPGAAAEVGAPTASRPDRDLLRPSVPGVFWAFLRLGLTAFGGPAMVAYIGDLGIVKRRWLTQSSFKEGVAVCQTIPGATAMQAAAYVGLRARGLAGAAAAYIGFGLPAFAFMVVLSIAYTATNKSPISLAVFLGLQVIVVAIVARATVSFGRTTVKGWEDAVVGLGAAAYIVVGGNPVVGIAGGALAGILLYRRVSSSAADGIHDKAALRATTRSVLLIALVAVAGLIALLLANRELFDLSTLMLRVDALAFGGGFASVPVMLHEVVGVRHWMSTRIFMDGIAMGQVTPGPIVITATFVGYRIAGLLGAALATVAVFLPSFLILALVVPHFDRMKASRYFQRAMRGILASFVGLLLAVTVKFALAVPWAPLSALLAVAAFTALMLKVEIPWVVVPGAIISAVLFR
jgi:chromate transporter